jgi:hypothetical protein
MQILQFQCRQAIDDRQPNSAQMRAYRRACRVGFSILKKTGASLRRTGNYLGLQSAEH